TFDLCDLKFGRRNLRDDVRDLYSTTELHTKAYPVSWNQWPCSHPVSLRRSRVAPEIAHPSESIFPANIVCFSGSRVPVGARTRGSGQGEDSGTTAAESQERGRLQPFGDCLYKSERLRKRVECISAGSQNQSELDQDPQQCRQPVRSPGKNRSRGEGASHSTAT